MTRKVLRGYIFSKTLLRSSGFSKALLRSSGRKILIGTVCLLVVVCLHPPVALAQHVGGGHAGGGFGGGHFGGGGGHFGGGGHSGSGHSGGGAHASAPRHSTPAPSAPAATSVLRSSTTILPFRTVNSASFRPRPRPVPLPRPQPTPIVFIPVYYTSPFFFWDGFNSFGWPGCNPFWGFGCYSPFYGYGGYYGGYGSYYGGYYGNYGFGSFGGLGLDYAAGTHSSGIDSGQSTTPQTYVSPSYPTDTRARDLVELFFKDGTVFNVTDYWLVDGQLHYMALDERGEKAVEHVAAFDTLDLQRTVDVNTERGFRFQLRGESMEQYLRNHPEVVPKVDPDAPHNQ